MGTYLRRRFPPTPEAVREARTFLKETLAKRGADEAAAEELVLALSELATNAVKHAGTPFEVVVETDGWVRLEVEDRSPDLPVSTPPSPTAESGRGLAIVDGVCDRWGVHVSHGTKCVWCERDLST
jgi:anti-sigma regulatory factor (Ser/Thr protein kinase)